MSLPRAVIFDMGQTIFAATRHDPVLAVDLMKRQFDPDGKIDRQAFEDVFLTLSADTYQRSQATSIEFTFESLCRLMCAQFGLCVSVSEQFEVEYFKGVYPGGGPEPGIHLALDYLESRGIEKAVLSNSFFRASTLRQEFIDHGLIDRFRYVISSSCYGVRKPHPALFCAAARRLGFEPGETWYVGDSLEWDVKGSHAAGMTPVWYNRRNEPVPPGFAFYEVKTWKEFIGLLSRM